MIVKVCTEFHFLFLEFCIISLFPEPRKVREYVSSPYNLPYKNEDKLSEKC
jgi:hypothetical protein